jgi:SAM-dependent methyltransferase
MRTLSAIDYDAVAPLYDAQPFRGKTADPELVAFLERRASLKHPSILDIACGTGSQLMANRAIVPYARLIGVDRSLGMLRQAQSKSRDIVWVQADAGTLPFQHESFDFITCQFAFHHVPNKAEMLRGVFQVLRPGGRFVMRNLCPQKHPDWIYYDYFPEALRIDLEDFWPIENTLTTMEAIGLVGVTAELEHLHFEQDLRVWLNTVRQRDINSQLMAISDRAYEAGLRRLERELSDADRPITRADHLCLVTIHGGRAMI